MIARDVAWGLTVTNWLPAYGGVGEVEGTWGNGFSCVSDEASLRLSSNVSILCLNRPWLFHKPIAAADPMSPNETPMAVVHNVIREKTRSFRRLRKVAAYLYSTYSQEPKSKIAKPSRTISAFNDPGVKGLNDRLLDIADKHECSRCAGGICASRTPGFGQRVSTHRGAIPQRFKRL